MYTASSKVLRYGVIAGLAVTVIGLIVRYSLERTPIIIIGLSLIVSAPIATLIAIATESLSKGLTKNAILAFMTALIITASIILSIIRR